MIFVNLLFVKGLSTRAVQLRFFKNTLRNRLIAAFLVIGLFSVTISAYIVVRVNTSRLRKQIKTAISHASLKTVEVIEQYQETSARIAEIYLANPEFVNSLKRLDGSSVIQTGNPFILWLPGEDKSFSYGKNIIRLQQPEVLISGTVEPVKDAEGGHLGVLLIGHELGKSFSQEMSLFTNVEIGVFYRTDIETGGDEKDRQMEQSFSAGEAYYDPNARFQGAGYEAYYRALLTRDGEVAGVVFAGIPKSFGFSEIVGAWTFFPILIGLAVIMAGGLGYTVADFISKPITTFTRGVLAVANGDLNQTINIDSTNELRELSYAFNSMTGKLRELKEIEEQLRRKDRLAALGELSAGVAHEIRNPLGIIKSSAQVMSKSAGNDEKTKELTGFIIEEVERLNRVITNFLDFARPQSMNKEYISMQTTVEKSLRLCGNRIEKPGIKVKKNFEEDLPPVLADEELMKQVFLNLLINAAEAIREKGTITINVRRSRAKKEENSGIEVVISDTGCGISEKTSQRIFNPFFSTKDQGTGLGLSIVHKIVEAHNGQITVKSTPGRGSAFTVTLSGKQ